jgi:hypothetical protein
MGQHVNIQSWNMVATVGVLTALLANGASFVAAELPTSSPTVQEEKRMSAEGGDILERGLPKVAPGKVPGGTKVAPRPAKPRGALPPNLCHQVTHMLTQCKCFNQTDCQTLTPLCPGSCPSGSQSCQCTPMFRGTPPPLPPNLCGYHIPVVITQCSCSNDADCQVLSGICPGSCPVGSQSCQCTPLQRR